MLLKLTDPGKIFREFRIPEETTKNPRSRKTITQIPGPGNISISRIPEDFFFNFPDLGIFFANSRIPEGFYPFPGFPGTPIPPLTAVLIPATGLHGDKGVIRTLIGTEDYLSEVQH